MKDKRLVTVIVAAVAIIIAIAAAFYFVLRSERTQLQQDKEAFTNQQKELVQEELQKLAQEYDIQYNKLAGTAGEKRYTLASDSIASQLEHERKRVNQLQQELRNTKTTSAKRIGELTREISTLRSVLRDYVNQIDSLMQTNARLRQENSQVRASYERVSSEAQQLSSEKAQLTDRVKLAAKLDATSISVTPMNKRGKAERKLAKVHHLQINFVVAKNVTAAVGEKTIYCRITQPNDELLVKPGTGTFAFEGKQIPYSLRRVIEYNGEESPVTLYWPVEESLQSGTYRLRLFADGNLIGSATFSL